jgi:hypothetical protein
VIRNFIGRIREYLTTGSNSLTRQVRVSWSRFSRSWWHKGQHDWSRPDYDFWRKAYYGRARGLELSGLFIKPLVSKVAAWVLGRPPQWKCESETSADELNTWWSDNHPAVLKAFRAALRQGDAFIVVNSDLTLTLVPPDWVEPMVSDADYSDVVGWRITQTVMHPTESNRKQTTVDEYTAVARIHRIEVDGRSISQVTYPNLIGRLPVVHIPNSPDDGETFGHPEAEALVEIMQRYGVVMEAAVEGNEMQGRPTPVISFETVQDLDKFWELYGTRETHTLPDGRSETVTNISVDLAQILTVSGATFKYESPGSFTADTQNLLGLMFYLILEHTELPEFVFGNAISSSKASAETQMPVFVRFIEMRQGEIGGWLTELAEIVLLFLSLTTPGVTAESPTAQWEELSQQDGNLTLATLQWAFTEGLLDEETALMLAPVDIEDIPAVLKKAKQERKERFEEAQEPGEDEQLAIFRDEVNRLEAEGE